MIVLAGTLGDGYEQTPIELRMGYKILKDAGIVPPEVEIRVEIVWDPVWNPRMISEAGRKQLGLE